MTRLLFVVVLALVTAYSPAAAQEEGSGDSSRTVRIRWVADGDTFATVAGEVVRLQGIDTPEKGREGRPDQYYAQEARQALAEMVQGKEAALILGPRPRDRHGRLLALVFLPDGTMVNEALVRRATHTIIPSGSHAFAYSASCPGPTGGHGAGRGLLARDSFSTQGRGGIHGKPTQPPLPWPGLSQRGGHQLRKPKRVPFLAACL